MALPEAGLPLDEAAFLIAAEADADLDVSVQLARLDEMAAQSRGGTAEEVCQLVFETLGFAGDTRTYDDPRNSYLNEVLDRRLGIPISLSVLLMEIGRRCGIALEGVGMPGHFLVRDPSRPDLLIDAFSGGRRLDRADCARLIHSVTGTQIELRVAMLSSVGTHAILTRMLANLDNRFRRRGDKSGVRWVTRMTAAIPGQSTADRIGLADGLAGLGCYDEAAELLEELASAPGTSGDDAHALRTRARGLLAPFN
jgi:regulator of sirC expression with transglutaminase-like and TPR domain